MNKKKISIIFAAFIGAVLLFSIGLAAWGTLKKDIPFEKIKALSESLGYDFDESENDNSDVELAEIKLTDSVVITYEHFADEAAAAQFFDSKVEVMSDFNDIDKTMSISLGGHYEKWYTTGKSHYQLIIRVDETILFIICDMTDIEPVSDFLKEIGY